MQIHNSADVIWILLTTLNHGRLNLSRFWSIQNTSALLWIQHWLRHRLSACHFIFICSGTLLHKYRLLNTSELNKWIKRENQTTRLYPRSIILTNTQENNQKMYMKYPPIIYLLRQIDVIMTSVSSNTVWVIIQRPVVSFQIDTRVASL